MDIAGLIIFLVIGAVAGWLAGTIMKGGGFGLLGNIVVGIVGGDIRRVFVPAARISRLRSNRLDSDSYGRSCSIALFSQAFQKGITQPPI